MSPGVQAESGRLLDATHPEVFVRCPHPGAAGVSVNPRVGVPVGCSSVTVGGVVGELGSVGVEVGALAVSFTAVAEAATIASKVAAAESAVALGRNGVTVNTVVGVAVGGVAVIAGGTQAETKRSANNSLSQPMNLPMAFCSLCSCDELYNSMPRSKQKRTGQASHPRASGPTRDGGTSQVAS